MAAKKTKREPIPRAVTSAVNRATDALYRAELYRIADAWVMADAKLYTAAHSGRSMAPAAKELVRLAGTVPADQPEALHRTVRAAARALKPLASPPAATPPPAKGKGKK